MSPLIWIHLAVTLCLTGLIWFVQIVHYPLFHSIPPKRFSEFHQRHQIRTTCVVAPLMLTEAICAIFLFLTLTTPDPAAASILGLGLVIAIWISTWLIQVPCHKSLEQNPTPQTMNRLVRTNWIRTVGWSGRSGVALWITGWASTKGLI